MQPIGKKRKRVAFEDGRIELTDLNTMRRRLAIQRGSSHPVIDEDNNKILSLVRQRPIGSTSPPGRKTATYRYSDNKPFQNFQIKQVSKNLKKDSSNKENWNPYFWVGSKNSMHTIRETCFEESVCDNLSKVTKKECEKPA